MGALDSLVDSIISAAGADAPNAFAVGTVVAVGKNSAADGGDLVTVQWKGGQYRVMYDADKPAPLVGSVVLMSRTQPMVILVTRLGGRPS